MSSIIANVFLMNLSLENGKFFVTNYARENISLNLCLANGKIFIAPQ